MSRPLNVLLVANAPDLITEWQAAEPAVQAPLLTYSASSARDAVGTARSRTPDLICLQPPESLAELRDLTRELREAAPHAVQVAVLDRGRFRSGDEQSAWLVEATRTGLRDFLHRPLSGGELDALMQRVAPASLGTNTQPSRRGRIACFVSNKGGVGKTTLAVNTACELAQRHPGRVLLVDAALQLGLCGTMLGMEPEFTMADAVEQFERLDPTLLQELAVPHPCGLRLLAAPGDGVTAARIREDHLARILSVAQQTFDYVVVDTFPILDGIAIAALDRADEVWQVVAPLLPSVLGAERLVTMLQGVGVEAGRQRLVVNHSVPSHSGQLSAQDVATRLGMQVDLAIPFSREAISACNLGEPVMLNGTPWRGPGKRGFRKQVRELAARIAGEAPQRRRRPQPSDADSAEALQ